MSSELLKKGAVVKLNKNLELSKDIYCHDFNPIKYFDMVGVVDNFCLGTVSVTFDYNTLWEVLGEDLLIVFEHSGIQSALPQDVEYVYYFDGTDPDGEEAIVGYKSNFEYYVDNQSEWTFLDDYSVADYLRKYGICIYDKNNVAKPSDIVVESVGGTTMVENAPIKSDGGSSSYYTRTIPEGMLDRFNKDGVIEAKDVMKLFLGNDYNFCNSFKAHCRVQSLREGVGKEGADEKYDLRKAWFFAQDAHDFYLESNK